MATRVTVCAGTLAFVVVVLRSAWLAEDAYISFRVVDNLLDGRGLVWNPGERVQVFTHPLWLGLVAVLRALTGELYYTATALSVGLSAAAAAVAAGRAVPSASGALMCLSALCGSKAFVDYSTSGLENPLTHLLLAMGLAALLADGAPRLRMLAAITGAALLNRLDLFLLFFPLLAVSAWRVWERDGSRGALLVPLAIALGPAVAWMAFSLLYYGSPFPNTAYAKLHTGLPRMTLVWQGLVYLGNLARWDPAGFVVLAGGLLAAAMGDGRSRAAGVGAGVYVVYVVCIGGDFMSGRFLTGPLLVSVVLLARRLPRRAALASSGVLLAVSVAGPRSPWTVGSDYGSPTPMVAHRIADERAFYYPAAGLLTGPQDETLRGSERARWGLQWRRQAEAMHQRGSAEPYLAKAGAIGYAGYYAGPEVYVINPPALSDAFLARLPPEPDPGWRIGHFDRALPEGYPQTLKSGRNSITDPRLHKAYEALRRITRDPLFGPGRLKAIWRLNTGGYDELFVRQSTADGPGQGH